MREWLPPPYYKESDASGVYVERTWEIAAAAEDYRTHQALTPASEDRFRIAAFGIDTQVDFCAPHGALYVRGAVEDTARTLNWLYRHIGKITGLFFSVDTHDLHQIFHPAWWRDQEGHPPAPLTTITAAEIRAGRWKPNQYAEESLAYCEALEASGRYQLIIWPYHTLKGSVGHALMPAFREAALFHSLVRSIPTRFLEKGSEMLTESYSVFSPEVRELNGRLLAAPRWAFLNELLTFDRIYVFGQAKSHCVRATLLDIAHHLQEHDPSALSRFYILDDAMSPVPPPALDPLPAALNFPQIAEQALHDLEAMGMRRCRTHDAISLD